MGNPYAFGTKSDETLALQQALARMMIYTGNLDGIYGTKTRDAVRAAQDTYGLSPADGVVRADLLLELGIHHQLKGTTPMNGILGTIYSGLLKNLLNWQLVQGYIRSALITVGGWIGLDGLVGASGSQTIIGALMVIIGVIFQAISDNTKKKALDVVKAADASPDVTVIPAHDSGTGKPIVVAAK